MGKAGKGKAPGHLDTTEADKTTPKSIIVYRGEVGTRTRALMHEWRQAFLPWSSKKLHGQNKSLRDYLAIAATFSVSHLQLFTAPAGGTSLRLMRFSNGPTLTFRVESFTLREDIIAQQRRPVNLDQSVWDVAPIVVLNNFNAPNVPAEVPLVEATLQSLFPSVNIQLIKTSEVQRVMFFNYDAETGVIESRHFYIAAKASGLSKTVKKLLEGRVPTKMGSLENMDEVLEKEGAWSDTDGEGEEVGLAQPFRHLKGQARIKLVEIGPRLSMTLTKIESGFAGGEVIYHRHESKSPRQVQINAMKVRSRKAEKVKRRAEQDAHVAKKKEREDEKVERRKSRRIEATNGQRESPLEVVGSEQYAGNATYNAEDFDDE